MANPAPRERSRSTERLTFNDLILAQVKDMQERIDRVEKNLDRVNARLDRQDVRFEKIDEKIDKLADKIDDLHKEIKSSANHGQIATISTVGIALAVIYSLLR